MDDYYFEKRKAGWKPDTFCEVKYCYANRASERFCEKHMRNQWAL